MNVLKKETKRRNHLRGTGGGSPLNINFSDIEEKLQLLTPEAAGIVNVPQGGVLISKKLHTEQVNEYYTLSRYRAVQLYVK